jgi:hypothetical protein
LPGTPPMCQIHMFKPHPPHSSSIFGLRLKPLQWHHAARGVVLRPCGHDSLQDRLLRRQPPLEPVTSLSSHHAWGSRSAVHATQRGVVTELQRAAVSPSCWISEVRSKRASICKMVHEVKGWPPSRIRLRVSSWRVGARKSGARKVSGAAGPKTAEGWTSCGSSRSQLRAPNRRSSGRKAAERPG